MNEYAHTPIKKDATTPKPANALGMKPDLNHR